VRDEGTKHILLVIFGIGSEALSDYLLSDGDDGSEPDLIIGLGGCSSLHKGAREDLVDKGNVGSEFHYREVGGT
jgi:hypothetical protein